MTGSEYRPIGGLSERAFEPDHPAHKTEFGDAGGTPGIQGVFTKVPQLHSLPEFVNYTEVLSFRILSSRAPIRVHATHEGR